MSNSEKKGKKTPGVCPLPVSPTEQEEAKKHWTEEAMKKAQPVPLPNPKKSDADSTKESEKED